MKAISAAVLSLALAAAMAGTFFLWGCSSSNASSTVCMDAGIDVEPVCVTTSTGGGW